MALNQRRMSILNLIREDGHAKVQKLAELFEVSDVTIRQDLEALENILKTQKKIPIFKEYSRNFSLS